MVKILFNKLYRRCDTFYYHSVVTLDTTIDVLHSIDARTLTLQAKLSRVSDAPCQTL